MNSRVKINTTSCRVLYLTVYSYSSYTLLLAYTVVYITCTLCSFYTFFRTCRLASYSFQQLKHKLSRENSENCYSENMQCVTIRDWHKNHCDPLIDMQTVPCIVQCTITSHLSRPSKTASVIPQRLCLDINVHMHTHGNQVVLISFSLVRMPYNKQSGSRYLRFRFISTCMHIVCM